MIPLTFVAVFCLALVCVMFFLKDRQFERERQEWTRERQLLITRIQAPEVGIIDSLSEADEEPSYEHFDEDELPD